MMILPSLISIFSPPLSVTVFPALTMQGAEPWSVAELVVEALKEILVLEPLHLASKV